MGLGTVDAPGSTSRPDRHRVAYGDVTVMTARTRSLAKDAREADRTTGEVRVRRHDPDAALHTPGGGAVTPGLAFAFTHIRAPNRNQQVILAVDPVKPKGPTEGNLAVGQYLEAAHHLPGLVGYAYDRALRGVHLDRLLKAGHIGLVGNHRNKGQTNDRYHGTETHHLPDGSTREVQIHLGYETSHLSMLAWQAYRNGQTEAIFAPQQVTPDTGKLQYQPDRSRTQPTRAPPSSLAAPAIKAQSDQWVKPPANYSQ